jgi:leucyl-tRNA synthetase
MELFGENFERYTEEEAGSAQPVVPTPTPAKALEAIDPSKAKKGKLNAKSTGLTYQFQILELIGVPREEIKKFAEPAYWLTYFPPIAKTDLNAIGARVDWRRQFVTSKSPTLQIYNYTDQYSRRQPILRLIRSMADECSA